MNAKRSVGMGLAAAMTLALGIAPSWAQPGRGGAFGGGGDRGMGGMASLLMSEDVRNEIALEQAQLEELEAMRDEIRDEMRERMQDLFRGMRDMSPEEREEARNDIRAEMQEIQQDIRERVGGVLTSGQMERLQQIELQQQVQRGGSRALLQGPLVEKLGITDEQQQQMREKAEEEQAKLQAEIAKLQQQARERVLSVLTDSQRAELDKMMGSKFEMRRPDFRGGGRGRPGDGGGRRGGRPARPEPELE